MSFSIPHYIDASVVVKLCCHEPDSAQIEDYLRKRWACEFFITEFAFYEVLGVLKRKWLKGALTEPQYFSSVSVLEAWIDERIKIDRDFRPEDRKILLDLRDLVKRRSVDYSDALQIYAVLNGKMKSHVGPCRSVLITADEGLAKAALSEGLRVWHYPNGSQPEDENA